MDKLKYLDCEIRLPLMSLPVRSVLVSTSRGNILISPGSQLSAEQLKSLGAVSDLIAPNLWHCGGILQAHEVFPAAKIWGPPDAFNLKPEIPWLQELSEKTWHCDEDLALVPIAGAPKISEFVFVHRASKTLILTDLAFNLMKPRGFGAWLILKMFGTYKRFAVSRFYMNSVADKKAFASSMQELFKYDFERIVVSHGEIVEANGKDLLRAALAERGIFV